MKSANIKNGKQASAQKQLRPHARPGWLVPVAIFFLTLAAFFPALQNGFVNWDDDIILLQNPHYRGLGWAQLRWMFTDLSMGHYQPLSWVTLGLDYLVWGMDPFGYHLTSLLLHGANAVIFYFIVLRLLSLAMPSSAERGDFGLQLAAAFAALLFALHPLRVESVAWATERRGVLAGLFFLLSLLCYLRAHDIPEGSRKRLRWMSAAVAAYGLSLLSKASGVALPVVLLVFDVYPLGRVSGGLREWLSPEKRQVWREKVPFVLLGLAAMVLALMAEHKAGAVSSLREYGIVLGTGQALFGLTFYLWKTLIPAGLSPLYAVVSDAAPAYWPFVPGQGAILVFSIIAALAVSVALFLLRRRWPGGLAGWVCYVALLAPVVGVVQIGVQIAADRYSYLPCLGWAVLAGGGAIHFWRLWLEGRAGRGVSVLMGGLTVAVLVGLGALTWKQAQVWHDSERLWKHTLFVSSDPSAVARNNLGSALLLQERLAEAVEYLHQALQINSSYVDAHYNLGLALGKQGQLEEAIKQFRQVLELNPEHAKAHNNIGIALASRGDSEGAMEHFRRALEISPKDVRAHNNLAIALAGRGDLEEAIKYFQSAAELDPENAGTHTNLANALFQRGDVDGAIRHLRRAAEISPADLAVRYNLAIMLASRGELEEAVRHFREALRIEPDFAEAHEGLGRALTLQGKRDEAVHHYQEALRIMKSRRDAGASK